MSDGAAAGPTWLDLYDYRERMASLYRERAAARRRGEDAAEVAQRFRHAKDALFARHPQSPLDSAARAAFTGLRYFPYDRAFCVEALLTPETDPREHMLDASGAHSMRFRRAARVSFVLAGISCALVVYWIDVYGGGLFLPFRDMTSGAQTYGSGRYLFDTVKGSDFVRLDADGAEDEQGGCDKAVQRGYGGGRILLDFNYAYNPSCAYDPRWVCPLAPA